jgi:hypothetical protein
MPSSVKNACIALFFSCISTFVAVYFNGIEFEEMSFSDPLALGMNFIWTIIVAWLIWSLYRGRDIKVTLLIVSSIMLLSVMWGILSYGFSWSELFYSIEMIMFLIAYCFLRSNESKEWFLKENL